ncbi:hypothetical protein HO173_010053 [Letharia columbiana]|uniref:Uncharacterized protein n=1 Tax=Letharia columbiana TaxID=112416 RepID=A0A8H6L183_9LECA|nr:uncharacterized protein HO173_010053 [Letharia columbiana]KAF6231751.1 hypothetical protein HO173_010053 [Letharia columbiana]
MFLEALLDSGAEGLQFTRSIIISMQNDKLGAPCESYDPEDDGLDFGDGGKWEDQGDDCGQWNYQPKVLNILLRLLISKVPNGCLQTFRWCHATRVSRKTLELVARRHGHCLTTLQIYNIFPWTFEADFSALTTLDAGGMHLNFALSWASKSVASSHNSLTHLKLGCETFLAQSYLGKEDFLTASEASDFTQDLDDGIRKSLPTQGSSKLDEQSSLRTSILTLQSLHLVGIDCGITPKIGAPTMLDIQKLTSLCLESCFNLRQGFPTLSPQRIPDAPPLLPQLRSFRLRQECSDASFQDGLKAFLLASKGLVHLAVLLEGSGPFLPPDCFVGNHGSTLRTLVWDQRQGARTKLDESTNTATAFMMSSSLDKIVENCPNLRELGLAVDALTSGDHAHLYQFSRLKYLKTLNIRNLPTQKADAETSSFPRFHAMIAMDVANALLSYGSCLETLGLGSTTWTDIWQGRSRDLYHRRRGVKFWQKNTYF